MSNAINSKSVPLTSIFDPYISGTTKARASGIDDAGTDTSNLYANIIYGSAAAATGIQSEDADLNTLYAAKGTAKYALPINGQTFGAAATGVLNKGATAELSFTTNTNGTYSVVEYTDTGNGSPTTTTLATGTWNTSGLPASSLDVQYTATVGSNGETQKGGWSTNPAPSWTAVTTALGLNDSVSVSFNEGSKGNLGTLQIQYRIHSTGQVISNSTIYFNVSADGSS